MCRQVVQELLKLKHPEMEKASPEQPQEAHCQRVDDELTVEGGGVIAEGDVRIAGLSAAESKARTDAEAEMDKVHYVRVPEDFVKTVHSRLMTTRQQCFVIDAPTSRPSVYTQYLQLMLGGITWCCSQCSLLLFSR